MDLGSGIAIGTLIVAVAGCAFKAIPGKDDTKPTCILHDSLIAAVDEIKDDVKMLISLHMEKK